MTTGTGTTGARLEAHRIMNAFTASRLLLIPGIAVAFMHNIVLTSSLLGAFMVLDLGDGVIARQLGVEDVRRRAIDSVVDRLAIDICLVVAMLDGVLPLAIGSALLARDAFCAVLCVRMFRRVRVAIKADIFYRALNGSIAAWALAAPFLGGEARGWLSLGLLAAGLAVATDLAHCVANVSRPGVMPAGAVVPARVARRLTHAASGSVGTAYRVPAGTLSPAR